MMLSPAARAEPPPQSPKPWEVDMAHLHHKSIKLRDADRREPPLLRDCNFKTFRPIKRPPRMSKSCLMEFLTTDAKSVKRGRNNLMRMCLPDSHESVIVLERGGKQWQFASGDECWAHFFPE
jgi:hypothetical protein